MNKNLTPCLCILLTTLTLTGCNNRNNVYTKTELIGSWISQQHEGLNSLNLQKNSKANGLFNNKQFNNCIWSLGTTLSDAENINNTKGNYLAVICHKANRIYTYHIDDLKKDRLLLNYVIWGKQFILRKKVIIQNIKSL